MHQLALFAEIPRPGHSEKGGWQSPNRHATFVEPQSYVHMTGLCCTLDSETRIVLALCPHPATGDDNSKPQMMKPQTRDPGTNDQRHEMHCKAADMVAEHPPPTYISGDCEIDFARRELRVRGLPVPIGGRTFEILQALVQSSGRLVTKDELMNRVWPGAMVTDNLLQAHAVAIRKALGPFRDLLKTEPGRGYRLLGDWAPVTQGPQRLPIDPAPEPRPAERSRRSNFPASLTRLVGRQHAVQRVRALMSVHRVVTLTGSGGIGKTALALEVARSVADDFPDRGWLIELASCSDPALVPAAVVNAFGPMLGSGVVPPETVAHAIGPAKALLVLDNCEHLIDAVATLVETILSRCPGAVILSTSREMLGIAGEYVYVVPSLDVPAAVEMESARIFECTGPELFMVRAGEAGANLSRIADHASAVGAICRHLDGIPLAIEFAAARAATLGVEQVAAGLRDRFALLAGGRRNAPLRHQTMRATLDWSYNLLTEAERSLLKRLARFAGPFSLASVCAVADADMTQSDVADAMVGLARKSLVLKVADSATAEFHLLETTRSYLCERLTGDGACRD